MVESKFKPCPGLNEGAANVRAWKLVCTFHAWKTIHSQTVAQETIFEDIFGIYEVRRYPLSLHISAWARLE